MKFWVLREDNILSDPFNSDSGKSRFDFNFFKISFYSIDIIPKNILFWLWVSVLDFSYFKDVINPKIFNQTGILTLRSKSSSNTQFLLGLNLFYRLRASLFILIIPDSILFYDAKTLYQMFNLLYFYIKQVFFKKVLMNLFTLSWVGTPVHNVGELK